MLLGIILGAVAIFVRISSKKSEGDVGYEKTMA